MQLDLTDKIGYHITTYERVNALTQSSIPQNTTATYDRATYERL